MKKRTFLTILGIILILFFSFNSLVKAEDQVSLSNSTTENTNIKEPDININITKTSINLGEEIEFSISINYTGEILAIIIEYDNNDADYLTVTSNNYYFQKYKYTEAGTYHIKVSVKTNKGQYNKTSESIKVEVPNEPPTVELISPSNNLTIKTDSIIFKFKANDDLKLNSCIYELYKKEGNWKTLEYNTTITSPTINKEYEISLSQFDDGNYTWSITCIDNNSEESSISRNLIVKTINYAREKEVLNLINYVDNFISQENKRALEENELIEDLGIKDSMIYYKKRLNQINQDLGNNINFLTDETLKEKRTIEILEELDKIIKNIPLEIKIIDKDDYIKNNIVADMTPIIAEYSQSKNLNLDSRKIKQLAKANLLLQDKITTTTNIKKAVIKYNNSEETYLIIKKRFKLGDNTTTTILEKLPENVGNDVEFKTPASKISNSLYEIKIEDLNSNEIVYIIKNSDVNIDVLKNTETFIFEENPVKNRGITGYFLFPNNSNSNPIIVITIILGFLILLFGSKQGIKKIVYIKYKNEENCKKIITCIKKSFESIKKEDLEQAKDEYHKIKEIYNSLPSEFKKNIFKKIEQLKVEIDKREMREFIREFEKAKKEKRTEDAKLIYEKIKNKYKKLPEKYQIKVYEKIILKN